MASEREVSQDNVVAVFDFDRTLIDCSSLFPFLRRVRSRRTLVRRACEAILLSFPRWNRARVKARFVGSVLRGLPVREVEATASRFADALLAGHLDEATIRRLEQHRAVGDTILVLSASLDVYLRPLPTRLELGNVLCTEVVHVNGMCTGELRNTQLHGPGKVEALRSWLAAHRFEHARVWAYGNSWQDRALLRFAEGTQHRSSDASTSGM